MANMALGWRNLADSGRVTASSQQTLMPASNLQNPHVERVWRARTADAYFLVDLQSEQMVSAVMVRSPLSASAQTRRVRLSVADPTAVSGDVGDSGIILSGDVYFDARYGMLVWILDTPVSARYIRVDLVDPDVDYVEAGRVYVGLYEQFTYNFAPGAQRIWVDRSRAQETTGGQIQTWLDNKYRKFDLNLEWVTEEQSRDLVEAVDMECGIHTDVLLMLDTEAESLPRMSVWGLMVDTTPQIQTVIPDLTSKTYSVRERL